MKNRMWSRVRGDALVWVGPCLVHAVLFEPDIGTDYADIYDGRDATSGKKFCRVDTSLVVTRHVNFGQGVAFDAGIFIHNVDVAAYTTVVFTPLEE